MKRLPADILEKATLQSVLTLSLAQLLHSLASLTPEACPHTEDMPQPYISPVLVQRPNHHTLSCSLGSFHNPSSLGPAGLAEQVPAHLFQAQVAFKSWTCG